MNEIHESTNCDECGRRMKKATRIYKNKSYCATCYARIFKRRLCPNCRNFARLPENDAEAVCKKCERNKPCIRCGKKKYKTGKITPYGPVCNSCAPHFLEPKPCPVCGRLSTRLTRVKRTNIEIPVCPKCARRDYETCEACGRHRLLHEAPDGKHLCKVCLEKGEIPCPSCGKLMPAGRGKTCNDCYWQNTFRKRLKMDQAGFAVPEMSKAFGDFGEWLLKEVGCHKAALTIHRYLPFFVDMEKRWKSIPAYSCLLAAFGAESLRRVRLPMRWLKKERGILVDNIEKENDSDKRRIAAVVDSAPSGSLAANALTGYQSVLIDRVKAEKTNLRSVRLAMRPAASLLLATDSTGERLPDQKSLDRYLHATPGQKAAVTGFINHLNKIYGLDLMVRIDKKRTAEIRRKKLETELIALLRDVNDSDEFRRKWISVALSCFHQLPKGIGIKLKNEQISTSENGGFDIIWREGQYWIPHWEKIFMSRQA